MEKNEWEDRFAISFPILMLKYTQDKDAGKLMESVKDLIREQRQKAREEVVGFIRNKITERGTYDLNYDDIYEEAAREDA